MTCRSCDTFSGDPCPVCRTCNRIKWLVQVGKLAVEQEAQAIQILRDCAGAIQDLVEAAGIHCRASESGERKSPVGRGETPEKEEPKKKKKKHHRHRDKEKAEEENEKESEGKKPDQTEKTKRKAKSESQEDSSEAGGPLTTRGARGKRRKQRSSQKRRLKRKRCLPEVTLEEKAQGRDLRGQ